MIHSRAVIAFVALVAGLAGTGPAAVRAQGAALTPGVALATFDSAWSRIDRTYFDTTFLATRWRALRDSLRPRAQVATTNNELRSILQTMLSSIGTSHFGIIPREASPVLNALEAAPSSTPSGSAGSREPGSAGIAFRLAGDELVVWTVDSSGPAWAAGVRPGMGVRAVGAVDLAAGVTQLASIDNDRVRRQARLAFVMRANTMLAGNRGDTLTLVVARENDSHTYRIVRGPIHGVMSRFGNLPPMNAYVRTSEQSVSGAAGRKRVGIISFSVWLPQPTARQLDSAFHQFREADAIILDLRGNPGGVAGMTGGVAGHLLDSAYALGAMYMRGVTLNLAVNPRRVAPDGVTPVRPFGGPVAILVDPLSASASEFFAAGLQGIGRVYVVGDTTAGASVPALMGRLPNGDVLLHAIADHLDSKGRRVEGRGVIPDEVVPLRAAALAAGRDEALTAALQWIARQPPRS